MTASLIPPELLPCPILIVDDSEMNLQLIANLLSRAGFQSVSCAKDGMEAIEKMATKKPDIIILDLIMPNMDGYTFCNYVKSLPDLALIPIIIQTAVEKEEEYDKIFAIGAADLIKKPIIPSALLQKVIEHLLAFQATRKR